MYMNTAGALLVTVGKKKKKKDLAAIFKKISYL